MKWNKYWQVSKITMTNSLVYFWNFLGRNVFFAFIMFVYMMLWRTIYAQKATATIGGLTFKAMIWYLVVTELVTLSRTDLHNQVNNDVKSGNVAYLLNKPYNYVIYCFSYFVGEIGITLLSNSIIGLAIGFIYAGALESFSIMHLPFIILSLLAGCTINFFIYMCLALTSFWVEENSAFFWIYSKLIFTIGGMLMPIELFPQWLQSLSQYMPFAYVTYVPARLAVDFSFMTFWRQFSVQLLYLGAFFALAMFLYRKGVRNLNVNGG